MSNFDHFVKVGVGYPGKITVSELISSVRSTIFISYCNILPMLLFSFIISYLHHSHDLGKPTFENPRVIAVANDCVLQRVYIIQGGNVILSESMMMMTYFSYFLFQRLSLSFILFHPSSYSTRNTSISLKY